MNVHRNMYAYDIKYYHTRYGWIMSGAVHIYVVTLTFEPYN